MNYSPEHLNRPEKNFWTQCQALIKGAVWTSPDKEQLFKRIRNVSWRQGIYSYVLQEFADERKSIFGFKTKDTKLFQIASGFEHPEVPDLLCIKQYFIEDSGKLVVVLQSYLANKDGDLSELEAEELLSNTEFVFKNQLHVPSIEDEVELDSILRSAEVNDR